MQSIRFCTSALSPSNIQSAFFKSGIYLFQSGDVRKLPPLIIYGGGVYVGDMDLPNLLAQANDEAIVKANEKQTECSENKRKEAAEHEAVDFFIKMGGEVQKKKVMPSNSSPITDSGETEEKYE